MSRSAPPTRLPGVASGPRHHIPPRRIRYGRGGGSARPVSLVRFSHTVTDDHPTNAAMILGFPTRYRILSARIRFYRPDKIQVLVAAVMVLEADDVVFPEIAAGLHLDNVQRDLTRVLQAAPGAGRDIGRPVLG